MSKSPATVATFRAWAVENGHSIGTRGRVSQSLVKQFTRETGRKVEPGTPEATVEVTVRVQDRLGRVSNRKRTLPISEVRALAGEAGKRGRLSAAALVAAGEALSV